MKSKPFWRTISQFIKQLWARRADRLNLIGLNELPFIDRWELEFRARGAVQPIYMGDKVALCRVLTRYKVFVDATDEGFGANLLLDGFWESWLTTFIARRINPGDFTVDVGANHGYYTLLMADLVGPTGRVASVEPNPAITRLLRRNVALNGFGGRVTILEQAATARDGETMTLCVPPTEPKNAYLVQSAYGRSQPAGSGNVSVRGGRLSTALRDWERVDFIKVDVEGAEEAVAAGLMPILERFRPNMVLEFNALRCGSPEALLDQLQSIYGTIQAVAFDGEPQATDRDALLDRNQREDWLLYLARE